MKCINPNCNYFKTEICDSFDLQEYYLTRRRHLCYKCRTRYTTLEIPIYIGAVNKNRRNILKQVITYFSGNNSCAKWKKFLD
jgi:transcriptional regulator NrdR family protein